VSACLIGEKINDLILNHGGIDVHHDQVLTTSVESSGLHCDIHPNLDCCSSEGCPQLGNIRTRALERDGSDRIARDAPNSIDVSTTIGNLACHSGDRRRSKWSTQHCDLDASVAARVSFRITWVSLHREALRGSESLNVVTQSSVIDFADRRRHEKGENQLAAYDDLLDIDNHDFATRQSLAQPASDAGAIGPSQCQQKGAGGCVVHHAQTSAGGFVYSA